MNHQEDAKEIADLMSTYVNTGGSKVILAQQILNDHRTLVQSKFGVFLEICKILADNYETGCFDLRNEDSCKIAKEILDNTDSLHLRFI